MTRRKVSKSVSKIVSKITSKIISKIISKIVSLEEYARNYMIEDGLSFYDMYEIEQQPNLDDIVASFFENDDIEDLDL